MADYKMLVVDDEIDNLDLLRRTFRREYQVLTAQSGDAALQVCRREPDLVVIITDQRMPRMTGVEFLRQTLDSHRQTIRMVLTAYTDTPALIDAINTGHVYQYVTKPYDPDALRLTVRRALERYELSMENERYRRQVVEKERLDRELEIARQIQERFWPTTWPRVEGFDLAARSWPAKQVGGDLFDVARTANGRLVLAVGDVSGKGVPAALYGAVSSGMLQILESAIESPVEVLTRLNAALVERDAEVFVCMSAALLDPASRVLRLTNSGLPYPIHVRGRAARFIETPGLPLGVDPRPEYGEEPITLEPGDLVVFATDGATEAMDADGRLFGSERLLDVVRSARRESAADVLRAVERAVRDFSGSRPPMDDLTLVVLKAQV
jgi:sigma-B regulation protein RsbU (phosphoserine phosphatase)